MEIMESPSAAHMLEGRELPGGWKVISKIKKKPNSTGGHFSVGYTVENAEGRKAFLKALDYSALFAQEDDSLTAIKEITAAFSFERDLMFKCAGRKMSRVVRAIDSGEVKLNGFPGINNVSYLIFERADEDVRGKINGLLNIDLGWALRALHQIGVGMNQLHINQIAHQDLKPSNVLIFEEAGSKLTDLGRAWDQDMPSAIDKLAVPGDRGYSPPEFLYGQPIDNEARFLGDVYLYGSMIFLFFAQTSASTLLRMKSLTGAHASLLTDNWDNDLPYLQHAFEESLQELSKNIGAVDKYFKDELIKIATELCQPDPRKRGNHLSIKRYNLEKYISKFDYLARLAEKGRHPN